MLVIKTEDQRFFKRVRKSTTNFAHVRELFPSGVNSTFEINTSSELNGFVSNKYLQALTRLDNLETQIKSLSLSRHKDVLARQHAELSSRVQETAQPALAQGRSLSERVGSGAPGAQGVERKVYKCKVIETTEL